MSGATASTVTLGLHPEHLADLRKSGLRDDTIAQLKISSARPSDIPKLIGFDPPHVTSALVFPYPGEDGFCRLKVFPSYRDKDGHTIKYLQRPKSGLHLYCPPLAEKVLKDPTISLRWTEGEKKSAKACQEGFACVALGGLWNWIADGHPTPKLDTIAHVDREELILPDSDVWSRPDLLQAVFAFGKELETRGAKVLVVVIPPGPDGEKRGLDDFLVQEGASALGNLKRIALNHKTFSKTEKWWKSWAKRKEATAEPHPDALKLLDRISQVRRLHPAQDFTDTMFYFGIPIGEELLLVTSERTPIRADQLPSSFTVDNRGFDCCRFSRQGILHFLSGLSVQGHTLLGRLTGFFGRFIFFRDTRLPLLLAIWTMGTYCYRIFRAFPYLVFRSPMKRCGKSRTLDVLALVAFNASSRTTNPTEAQLFRGPGKNGGTMLLDEVEQLRGDKEAFHGLLTVLNSGFEQGGVVTRLEKRGERFVDVQYPTYAPRALAGISRLAETLEDRAILIFMARKLKHEKVERFSPSRLEQEAQSLRDQLYIWALTHAADLAEVYAQDAFPALRELDDRARDLWEPLLSIALLADVEAEETGETTDFAASLTRLARDLSGVRDETETTTVTLIEALSAITSEERREEFQPAELLRLLQARGFDWLRSTKALASLLNPLGFFKKSSRRGQKVMKAYAISPDVLADLRQRYGGAEETAAEAQGSGE